MWVFDLFDDFNIIKLNIQKLIHRLESAANRYIVFELNRHLMIDKSLEEAGRQNQRAQQEARDAATRLQLARRPLT